METYERKRKLTTTFVMLLGVSAVGRAAWWSYVELMPVWSTLQTDVSYFSNELFGEKKTGHPSGKVGTLVGSCLAASEVGIAQIQPNRAEPTEFTIFLRSVGDSGTVNVVPIQDCAVQQLPEYTLIFEVENAIAGNMQTVSQP